MPLYVSYMQSTHKRNATTLAFSWWACEWQQAGHSGNKRLDGVGFERSMGCLLVLLCSQAPVLQMLEKYWVNLPWRLFTTLCKEGVFSVMPSFRPDVVPLDIFRRVGRWWADLVKQVWPSHKRKPGRQFHGLRWRGICVSPSRSCSPGVKEVTEAWLMKHRKRIFLSDIIACSLNHLAGALSQFSF